MLECPLEASPALLVVNVVAIEKGHGEADASNARTRNTRK